MQTFCSLPIGTDHELTLDLPRDLNARPINYGRTSKTDGRTRKEVNFHIKLFCKQYRILSVDDGND